MKKGFFHRLDRWLIAPAVLIIATLVSLPLSAQSLSNARSHQAASQHALFTRGDLTQPQKMLSGSYSNNRLKGKSRRKFTPRNVNRVRLQSKFPRKLGIANYDVAWKVKSLKGRNTKHSRGKIATLNLSPGKYRVTLRIGKYKQNKTITVRRSRNNMQTFSVPVKAGLLKVNTGTNKSPNARIYVKNSKGKVVASSKGRSIKRLLPSGKYTVEVSYGNKRHGRNVVHVRKGSIKETTVKMPATAKVRLRAFVNGNQPLMKKSTWVVYNSKGKEVKRTKTRTLRVSLLPGSYTARLTVGGKHKKKKFRVSSGQRKTVSINL